MAVRDDHGGELGGVHVLLQIDERAVAAIHPDGNIARPEEITAARAARGRTVRAGGPKHCQLHDHASTCSTSGPRNRAPSVRNVSTSPLVMNIGVAARDIASAPVVAFSSRRTSNAVSSALDTSTTSGPMTSLIVRASKG